MSVYDSEYQTSFADPYGAAVVPRVVIELADDSLLTLDNIVRISPIRRARERKYGVVQPLSWQIVVPLVGFDSSNESYALTDYTIIGCWAFTYMYAEISESTDPEPVANGKINDVSFSTNGTATIEVSDVLVDLLNTSTDREYFFSDAGWAGDISAYAIDDDSAVYDNDWSTTQEFGVTVVSESDLDTETFRIVFTSATAYKIILENDTELTGFVIGTDATFGNVSDDAGSFLTIDADGWSVVSNAYSVGDEFRFYTCVAVAASSLYPTTIIYYLLETIVGATVRTIGGGSDYSVSAYDVSNWAAEFALDTANEVGGFWPIGSNILQMIQELLTIKHASIYTAPTGQVALWVLGPASATQGTLNGDIGDGAVQIVDDSKRETVYDETYNRFVLNYRNLSNGGDKQKVDTADASDLAVQRTLTISTSWRVKDVTAAACVNKCKTRFANSRDRGDLQCTIEAAGAGIDEQYAISDASLGLNLGVMSVVENTFDIMAQRCRLLMWQDPVAVDNYAIVGVATSGSSDLVL